VILRRATLLSLLAAVLLAGGASARPRAFTPPALQGTPRFLISGHGWGHGVGMSQYGAYGYAQRGWTYDKILAHYYPGTELGPAPISKIRVLLASTASVTISSIASVKVKDGAGTTATLDPGTWTLGPQLKLKLPGADQAQPLVSPVTFTPTTAPLYFKKPYRGAFTLSSDGTRVTLVDAVSLEQYLYGVVPSEMPYTWAPEALKAQAVAARSYALAVRKTTGAFDVYADTRSQVYGGVLAEKPSTTDAVDQTVGEVLLYDGKVAVTYFYSSSGGRTAAIADVWNAQPVPYLVSVSDPYDAISPYHDWGPFAYTAAKLQKAFKVPGRLLDVQTTLNPSGRVSVVTAVGERGEVTISGADVRARLGLRSTWFRVGVLALDPLPRKTVVYGTAVTLTGLGRGLSDLTLEQLPAGTTEWQPLGGVTAAPDGTVQVTVKAAAPVQYRLTSGGVSTDPTKLLVAPKVRLKLPSAPTALSGIVRPASLAGAPVQIQRSNPSGGWTTVARGTVDARGAFSIAFTVAPGTYRARVAAGKGWAVALSPQLQVVST
jgi:stage II sporulation protein D